MVFKSDALSSFELSSLINDLETTSMRKKNGGCKENSKDLVNIIMHQKKVNNYHFSIIFPYFQLLMQVVQCSEVFSYAYRTYIYLESDY